MEGGETGRNDARQGEEDTWVCFIDAVAPPVQSTASTAPQQQQHSHTYIPSNRCSSRSSKHSFLFPATAIAWARLWGLNHAAAVATVALRAAVRDGAVGYTGI